MSQRKPEPVSQQTAYKLLCPTHPRCADFHQTGEVLQGGRHPKQLMLSDAARAHVYDMCTKSPDPPTELSLPTGGKLTDVDTSRFPFVQATLHLPESSGIEPQILMVHAVERAFYGYIPVGLDEVAEQVVLECILTHLTAAPTGKSLQLKNNWTLTGLDESRHPFIQAQLHPPASSGGNVQILRVDAGKAVFYGSLPDGLDESDTQRVLNFMLHL